MLEGPLSALQMLSNPLTLISPGHWATLGNYCSGLPGETIIAPASDYHLQRKSLVDFTDALHVHILIEMIFHFVYFL